MEANSLWRKYLHHLAQNVVYAGVFIAGLLLKSQISNPYFLPPPADKSCLL
jgi:hypothetical protein